MAYRHQASATRGSSGGCGVALQQGTRPASRLRMRKVPRFTCAAWVVLCSLFVGSPATAPAEPWHTTQGQDHPLVGRIWDVAAARFIDQTTLTGRLASSHFVLLGEKHDNPDHHRLQAYLLQAMTDAGRRPAVGFEMFSVDDAAAITRHLAEHPTDAAGLAEAIDWGRRGWPDWALYQPIVEVALQEKLPLIATNISQATARTLSRGGLGAVDAELRARWRLDRTPPPDGHAAMLADLREAHCGYVAEGHLDAMLLVQRARDAQMAMSLAAAGQSDGAVLIAGAGHVRRDYGVPVSLVQHAPGVTIVSLAFLEVRQGSNDPAAYVSGFRRSTVPFDYVWFTPRVDDEDPCVQFQEQLQKLRQKK